MGCCTDTRRGGSQLRDAPVSNAERPQIDDRDRLTLVDHKGPLVLGIDGEPRKTTPCFLTKGSFGPRSQSPESDGLNAPLSAHH